MPDSLRKCIACDQEFYSKRNDAKFCSGKCRQIAYRGRCANYVAKTSRFSYSNSGNEKNPNKSDALQSILNKLIEITESFK